MINFIREFLFCLIKEQVWINLFLNTYIQLMHVQVFSREDNEMACMYVVLLIGTVQQLYQISNCLL